MISLSAGMINYSFSNSTVGEMETERIELQPGDIKTLNEVSTVEVKGAEPLLCILIIIQWKALELEMV